MDIQSLVVAHMSNCCLFTPLGASVENRYYGDCNRIILPRPRLRPLGLMATAAAMMLLVASFVLA